VIGEPAIRCDHSPRVFGEIPGIRGTAFLVVDDAQGISFLRGPQDSADEVVSIPSKEPGCAQDQMIRTIPADERLAQELGFPVDALRIWGVFLDVRALFPAIENIIGAVVDEQRSNRRGRRRQVPGSVPIDPERFLFAGFTGVDLCKCGSILMTISGRRSLSFA